jgi:hypothetical protein
MTNENHPKVRDLLDNYDNYMDQLIAMSDKVLEKKLHLARIQMQMALEQQKFVEVDVLYLFWKMIVQARVKRMEMGIEDEEWPEDEAQKPVKRTKKEKQKEIKGDPSDNDDYPELENENEEDTLKPEQLSLF